MARVPTQVIVGGGLAGAEAAAALLRSGFEGRVVLVEHQSELPYERPPLSKEVLRGDSQRQKALVHAEGFYSEQDIELWTGAAVVDLSPGERRVTLNDGTVLQYDALLLATGAIPRRPPIPGVELVNVRVLRTIADAERLRGAMLEGGPLVIIGAGWIGCEVAASARQLGVDVTLVDQLGAPLERVFGPYIGGWMADVYRANGVQVRTGAAVDRIGGGRLAERVVLTDGAILPAETVLLAVGVTPDSRLAERSGLATDDGIVADAYLRTSASDVFAAGDVARVWHPRYERDLRLEHWSDALHQGRAAADSMLGRGEPYARLPYLFSDQYDVGIEYVCLHAADDRLVVRGSIAEATFQAFWVDASDRISAGMHVNDWGSLETIKRLVESAPVVDTAVLADPDTDVDQAVV